LILLKKNIKDITVYKNTKQGDGHLNNFDNLSEFGIIFIKYEGEIKTNTQSEINTFFGLENNNPIYILTDA